MTELPERAFAWAMAAASDALGSLRDPAVRWMGRSSTDMHALDVTDAHGRRHHLAVRRYVDAERLATDPWYVPECEARVLRLLEGSDVPAPRLLGSDEAASRCDVPTLLTTRVPGAPPVIPPDDLPGFLRGLAEPLAAIHEIDGTGLPQYAPYNPEDQLRPPAGSSDPAMWERVFETLANQPPPDTPLTFIHRDYHHWQTLWQDGMLTGIVDWSTGCLGPPGIDHARARLNLAWDVSVEAADDFLEACEAMGAYGRHPYWDLMDVADSLPDFDDLGPEPFARFEAYVARLLDSFG